MNDFKYTEGSRALVFHGTAKHTSGGLMKSDLLLNKNGRIVSKKKHNTAKKNNNLEKAGYFAEKGRFGAVYIKSVKKRPSKSRKNKNKTIKNLDTFVRIKS